MRERRKFLLAAVAIVTAAVGLLLQSADTLRRPELASVDARFHVRGTQRASDVVVVGVDKQTLDDLRVQGQLVARRYQARMIDTLRRAGAKVIAYDFQFTEASDSEKDDIALYDALKRTPGVVLAISRVRAGRVQDQTIGGTEVRSVPASVNFRTDGGVIRRVRFNDFEAPTFAVAAARRAGVEVDRDDFSGDGAWINVPGGAGTIETRSFSQVLDGETRGLRGKVVVVGAVDPILQDIHTTAFGEGVPGPEVEAAAIQTILDDFPLRDAPGWVETLVILLAALGTPFAALRFSGLRWLPVPALSAVVLAVGDQLAFNGGKVVAFAVPATTLLLSFLGTLAVAYATDLLQRRRLKLAFSRFVPPAVVDEVVALAGDELRLGGERREGTVLFSDLRGFTSHAEHLTPEQVIELLNRYLTEMSDAILDHGGTVVSYMGDGIMAVFGAPIAQDDHADRALAAAEEMLGPRLKAFTDWAGADLKMGIGLCTGSVMSGNVGSQRRLEYTAVGDTTNTASRLESMTKDHGVPILISDATRQALTNPRPLKDMGELPIRGREQTLHCWTLA